MNRMIPDRMGSYKKLEAALKAVAEGPKEIDSEMLREAQRRGVIPPGFIEPNAFVDKWENNVSILHLADGMNYNIVHHWKPFHRTRRSTLYGGRGKFMRITEFSTDNPCAETWIEVGGYKVSWGDGDNLGVECNNPCGIDLTESLKLIRNDNFECVIVTVVSMVGMHDNAWTYKEVGSR